MEAHQRDRLENLVRCHGVLAPHAKDRDKAVPCPPGDRREARLDDEDETPPSNGRRMAWARLLKRVFRVDVSVCPACGGSMRIVACLTDPFSIRRYLKGVGLPTEPPEIAPARSPPQRDIDF